MTVEEKNILKEMIQLVNDDMECSGQIINFKQDYSSDFLEEAKKIVDYKINFMGIEYKKKGIK